MESRAFSIRWYLGRYRIILRKSWRIYPHVPYQEKVILSIFPIVILKKL